MIEDAVTWLVTFSTPYHLAWFLLSMFGVLAALLSGARRCDVHGWLLVGHCIVVIEAVIMTTLDIRTQVFSVHCIWFNALMAFGHWRLLLRAQRSEDLDKSP